MGATVSARFRLRLMNWVTQQNFNFVIFELGSNDLANHVPELEVAVSIVSFAEEVLKTGVKRIFIAFILERALKRNGHIMYDSELIAAINLCNTMLYHLCFVEKDIFNYKHKETMNGL
jgi:hypothetical protein